jgi:cytochrome c5
MAETIVKVLLVVFMASGIIPGAAAQDVEERYSKSCAVCHAAGAAGAPKTGNAEEWAPRLEKGMHVLVKSVEEGLNAMPPKGMCFDCSAEDYEAMIVLMSKPK